MKIFTVCFCSVILLLLSINLKSNDSEYINSLYLVAFENTDENQYSNFNKITILTSGLYPNIFYSFKMRYAGRIILTKDKKIEFYGPDSEKMKLMYKELKENSKKDKKWEQYSSEEILNMEHNFSALAWNEIVYKNPNRYKEIIDEEFGEKLQKEYEKKEKICSSSFSFKKMFVKCSDTLDWVSKKDYFKIFKYINWSILDTVYYVDGDYECLYKKGSFVRRLSDIPYFRVNLPAPDWEEAPRCKYTYEKDHVNSKEN
ncbi:hypothetical protein Dip518_000063 [Parelusimicrobium proximum]|uniref:hypothetical protein n=1 Tax=Parelusimicrobium proximum TaxID=3228953 RepID=UPI003D1808E6